MKQVQHKDWKYMNSTSGHTSVCVCVCVTNRSARLHKESQTGKHALRLASVKEIMQSAEDIQHIFK